MRSLVIAFAALAIAAPAWADGPASGVSLAVQPPAPAPAPPQSVWRQTDGGGLEHLQSGLSCPATLGAYSRVAASLFDGVGLDVGCSYTARTTVISLYLTKQTGQGLTGAMAEAQRQLLEVGAPIHPTLISESRLTEEGLDWAIALYAEDGGLHSAIWIADLNGWTFEYRVTYLAADEAGIASDLKAATALVQSSAGARLGLCARSKPPKRKGAMITNARQIQSAAMMSSILGGAAMGVAADKGKDGDGSARSTPITWCVETAIVKAPYHMLLWRGVDPTGADLGSDQITLATNGPPPTLALAADSLAGLVSGGSGPPNWVATVAARNGATIYGYFGGRPSAEAASDLFVGILSGKARAVGGYSAEGGNVTISMPADK